MRRVTLGLPLLRRNQRCSGRPWVAEDGRDANQSHVPCEHALTDARTHTLHKMHLYMGSLYPPTYRAEAGGCDRRTPLTNLTTNDTIETYPTLMFLRRMRNAGTAAKRNEDRRES